MSVCCMYLCPTCFSRHLSISIPCCVPRLRLRPRPRLVCFPFSLFCSVLQEISARFLFSYGPIAHSSSWIFPYKQVLLFLYPVEVPYVLPVSVCIAFSSLPRHSLPVRPSPSQVRCPPRQPTPWRKLYVLIFNGKLLSHYSLWRRQSRAEPHRVELLSGAIQTVNFNDTRSNRLILCIVTSSKLI